MLAKKNRLCAQKDYDLVYKKGQTYFSPFFNVRVMASPSAPTRFGIVTAISISKKATVRNLVKRRIRAVFTTNLAKIKDNLSITIHTKPACTLLNYQDLEAELLFLLKKAGAVKN